MIIKRPDKNQIPMLKALWKQAFGDSDKYIDSFFAAAFSDTRCRCAEKEGEILAALYWFDCEYRGKRIAYLYAIATKQEHRGKGICSHLMRSIHQELKDLGYSGAILVPGSPELFSFYNKLGYNDICYINEFDVIACDAVDIKNIDRQEFQVLRRNYIGQSGVIQEKENLDFLSLSAEFYAGDDFVLAVRKDANKLFCIELLGNTDTAGGIASALGYDRAVIRTAGCEKPFALWLPLGKNLLPCPDYFGLAFD